MRFLIHHQSRNLMRQVCYTEPPGKSSVDTVWKRAGAFKKYLAGHWMSHLYITVYQRLTSTNQINEPYDIIGEQKHIFLFSFEKSLQCRSFNGEILSSSAKTDSSIYANLFRWRHCSNKQLPLAVFTPKLCPKTKWLPIVPDWSKQLWFGHMHIT